MARAGQESFTEMRFEGLLIANPSMCKQSLAGERVSLTILSKL